MSKFDLSRIVGAGGVSESDTELREIFLDKIRENPENFYPPLPEDEAESLRESIQANGLLEPLLVVPDGVRPQPAPGSAGPPGQRLWHGLQDGPVPGTAGHGCGPRDHRYHRGQPAAEKDSGSAAAGGGGSHGGLRPAEAGRRRSPRPYPGSGGGRQA